MQDMKDMLIHIDKLQEFVRDNPLSPEFEKSVNEDFKVRYTYDSNAIEGNTLTLIETKIVLEGITIGGKSLREHLEIINHAEAIDYIQEIVKEKEPLSEKTICAIHSLILQGINKKEAGIYRSVSVKVGDFYPPQPFLLKPQMENFIQTYHNLDKHPILKASYAHLEFVRIHPFVDGNGRTARLLMNLELLKAGYCAVNISFEKRNEYYKAIREYSNYQNGTSAFDMFLASCMLETLENKKELALMEIQNRKELEKLKQAKQQKSKRRR